MENKEISSIQWLVEKYTIVCGLGSKELMKEHIDMAKKMHKQEIIYATEVGYTNGNLNNEYDGHQHYQEMFE